jgi:MOSC domain-containing protein YiiM
MPKDVSWHGRTVFTGVFKDAVAGSHRVGRLNVEGDGQGDVAGHGGEQRAVFVYQIESYRYWERELGREDFVYGQFGENFTVEGLADDEVCIGDRYRIGTATFEVTQPRVTCYRVGLRMNDPRMPALLGLLPCSARATTRSPPSRSGCRPASRTSRRTSSTAAPAPTTSRGATSTSRAA